MVPVLGGRTITLAPEKIKNSIGSVAVHMVLQGRVQGIGVRPAIVRWANDCGVTGWVANCHAGVEIHIEGNRQQKHRFVSGLPQHLPREASLSNQTVEEVFVEGCDHFVVISVGQDVHRVMTSVPRDLVVCASCEHDVLYGEEPRRHSYPFTSCTKCGPRYSILEKMPYERENTKMREFSLCPACEREFGDANDIRFHAQTIACQDCGPQLNLTGRGGLLLACGAMAQNQAAQAILGGNILAVKGIGGYQLICDATNDQAVQCLRKRKGRRAKPLALMVQNISKARLLAEVKESENALLDPAGPIVLCPARTGGSLSRSIHPGLREVGLMLPTTPLHALLCETTERPLVVTSGNHEGEPLAYTNDEAQTDLASVADLWLHHDRIIHRPIDDSVVRCMAGRRSTIRLARGLAPMLLVLAIDEEILAVGGQQKVALAISNGHQAVLGPHLGDLDTVAAQERFVQQQKALSELYCTSPKVIAHDLHPDYFTTRWAESQPLRRIGVQHHHAHVVTGMLQHGWLDKTVLGVAFDGTGYGLDGTIWGGEFLLSTVTDFQRVAHLRPFRLLGGEEAIHQPQRIALSLLRESGELDQFDSWLPRIGRFRNTEEIIPLLERPHLHPLTTSVGRLFDGVASLILGLQEAHYEGESAMRLEAACDVHAPGSYRLALQDGESLQLDWRPMLQALLGDLHRETDPGVMAMRFHRGLAQSVVSVVKRLGSFPVVLTGGCFQNKILVELIQEQLAHHGQPVGLPGEIPHNDGGLAAGQLVVAAARLNRLHSLRTKPCV